MTYFKFDPPRLACHAYEITVDTCVLKRILEFDVVGITQTKLDIPLSRKAAVGHLFLRVTLDVSHTSKLAVSSVSIDGILYGRHPVIHVRREPICCRCKCNCVLGVIRAVELNPHRTKVWHLGAIESCLHSATKPFMFLTGVVSGVQEDATIYAARIISITRAMVPKALVWKFWGLNKLCARPGFVDSSRNQHTYSSF